MQRKVSPILAPLLAPANAIDQKLTVSTNCDFFVASSLSLVDCLTSSLNFRSIVGLLSLQRSRDIVRVVGSPIDSHSYKINR